MKVILAGPYPEGTKEMFQQQLKGCELAEVRDQQKYDALEEGDIIVVRVLKTTKETLKSKKELKAVIRWGAGYDSVDIQGAGRRGILVATTPGANAYAVSELALTLMLGILRRIPEQNESMHEGIWDNSKYVEQMTSLNHKTVGIIGGGNIGRRVAGQVQAFGAKTIYYDVKRLEQETEQKLGLEYLPFEELIQVSDVITIHIPLLDSTKHMIGAEEIRKMKAGVYIVNTARGGLIDDEALAEGLRSGTVAGAGLDCVENEDMEASPFRGMKNVILTPHIGGNTNDLPQEMVPRISEQIRNYARDKKLDYVVNKAFLKQSADNE